MLKGEIQAGKMLGKRCRKIDRREGDLNVSFQMKAHHSRITVNPRQCGGRPCIRGMRIRVVDVLDLLSAGLSPERILDELPDLEMEDIRAAFHHSGGESSRDTSLAFSMKRADD